jgi:hypothetical protein
MGLRHVEEMMQVRGVFVDHSIVHRWANLRWNGGGDMGIFLNVNMQSQLPASQE